MTLVPNHVESVAIIGAGGTIGKVISKALISQGKHKVTAVTRKDSSSALPSDLHAVKYCDYEDHASIVSALQGQEVLIITMNARVDSSVQFKLIDAALEAKVAYIMPNEYGRDHSHTELGKDTFLGPRALKVREYIAEKGHGQTHWIALSCSFWYEYSLAGSESRYGFDLDTKTLTLMDDGNTKITTTTWPQVGRAVAAVFALPIRPDGGRPDAGPTLSGYANSAVLVQSFTVSQRDMFASLLRVTRGAEADWTIAHEPSHARYQRGLAIMQQGDITGFALLLYARVFYPGGDGDVSHKVHNAALGLPEESLDEATKEALKLHEAQRL